MKYIIILLLIFIFIPVFNANPFQCKNYVWRQVDTCPVDSIDLGITYRKEINEYHKTFEYITVNSDTFRIFVYRNGKCYIQDATEVYNCIVDSIRNYMKR